MLAYFNLFYFIIVNKLTIIFVMENFSSFFIQTFFFFCIDSQCQFSKI